MKCAVTELNILFPSRWLRKRFAVLKTLHNVYYKPLKKWELEDVVTGRNQYPVNFSYYNGTDYDLKTAFSKWIYLPNYFKVDNILFLTALFAVLLSPCIYLSCVLISRWILLIKERKSRGLWWIAKDQYKQHAASIQITYSESLLGTLRTLVQGPRWTLKVPFTYTSKFWSSFHL